MECPEVVDAVHTSREVEDARSQVVPGGGVELRCSESAPSIPPVAGAMPRARTPSARSRRSACRVAIVSFGVKRRWRGSVCDSSDLPTLQRSRWFGPWYAPLARPAPPALVFYTRNSNAAKPVLQGDHHSTARPWHHAADHLAQFEHPVGAVGGVIAMQPTKLNIHPVEPLRGRARSRLRRALPVRPRPVRDACEYPMSRED